jgi:hypothetical protein
MGGSGLNENVGKLKNKTFMNYDVTLELTRKKLIEAGDPQEMADKSGTTYLPEKQVFQVPFLGQEYLVSYPSGEVTLPGGVDVPVPHQIAIIHYLITAEGEPLRHKWISFKELPSGQIYISPFNNRVSKPLLQIFGQEPASLLKAAAAMGGKQESMGDASVTIPVFPMVSVTYLIWAGDEEFPASATVLFDESAPFYLPTEDYTVISSAIVFELKKKLQ